MMREWLVQARNAKGMSQAGVAKQSGIVQQSYQLIEMKKEDPVAESIMNKLRSVSPDDLSPREAWQMLADLAAEAGRKES